jgi:MFS family permease
MPTSNPAFPALQQTAPAMGRVIVLLALSVVINYIDRSNLSIAAPLVEKEMHISAAQLGTLLSAFFWTYSLSQILSGWLVDRFDVKGIFALGFFLWSVSTAVTGIAHGFAALLVMRVVLGIGESVSFPSYGKIVGTYFTEERRGFANSIVITGLAVGPAIGLLIGGAIVGHYGWRPFFIVVGLAGLLWLIPWWAWMPRRQSGGTHVPSPWTSIVSVLRKRAAWAMSFCHFAYAYPLYFLLTWLPYYLTRARGLTVTQMSRAGALVFLVFAVASAGFGKLSDRWITTGTSPSLVRKGFGAVGTVGTGLFLIFAVQATAGSCLWMLCFSGVFLGLGCSSLYAAAQTIAGAEMVGRWMGVQQCLGNLAGAVAPAVAGFLLGRTGGFYWPFAVAAAVSCLGGLSWILFVGPVEELSWGELKLASEPTPTVS